MQILAVTSAAPPHAFGGSDLYALDLATALAADHEVHVFARAPLPPGEMTGSSVRGAVGYTTFTSRYAGRDRSRRIRETFRGLLERLRPDVVHIQHLANMPLELPRLAAERGIAVVFTLHDFWTICQRTFLVDAGWRPCGGPSALGCWRCLSRVPDFVPRAGPFERLTGLNARALVATAPGPFHRRRRRVADMLAHVDLFVSPTRHLRDRLLRYVNLPEADIVVRPFGLAPLPPRTTGTPAEGRLRIGFVGSVNFHKGAHVLLDAFAGGLDAELVVFGRMSPAFEAARGNELRARAAFHGVVDSARRREIYDAMDVLVLPSVCHENFPLVIAEAFMAGVPVVASNLAGMAEVVRHDVDGLLVPPGDAGALRGALKALIDDRPLVERLRQAAPPVKSLTAHAHEMAEVFDQARARARRRARGRR